MLARTGLDAHEALVCTMVLVAASDGAITDREIGVMSGLVQSLPAFHDFSLERLQVATEAAVGLLEEDEGLAHAMQMIHKALSPKLRETAYALACDVVAGDATADQQVLRMLEFILGRVGARYTGRGSHRAGDAGAVSAGRPRSGLTGWQPPRYGCVLLP